MEKKKILVIDDEKTFTQLVRLNLEKTGKYEVMTENRGSKSLFAARKFKPDMILLDILMPDITGGEVGYQLKNDADTKNIPIVFMTAIVTEEETNYRDSNIGGYPFIPKTASLDKLINIIEKNTG